MALKKPTFRNVLFLEGDEEQIENYKRILGETLHADLTNVSIIRFEETSEPTSQTKPAPTPKPAPKIQPKSAPTPKPAPKIQPKPAPPPQPTPTTQANSETGDRFTFESYSKKTNKILIFRVENAEIPNEESISNDKIHINIEQNPNEPVRLQVRNKKNLSQEQIIEELNKLFPPKKI